MENNLIIKKTITIVIMIALLFTTGFVLGAVTAEVKELAPVVDQVEDTTTTVPSTEAPTTEAPTTQAPTTTTTTAPTTETTTEATTETTTSADTSSSADSSAESTTGQAGEEGTEEEPCFLIKVALTILEFCKTVIDFIISILSSL